MKLVSVSFAGFAAWFAITGIMTYEKEGYSSTLDFFKVDIVSFFLISGISIFFGAIISKVIEGHFPAILLNVVAMIGLAIFFIPRLPLFGWH